MIEKIFVQDPLTMEKSTLLLLNSLFFMFIKRTRNFKKVFVSEY